MNKIFSTLFLLLLFQYFLYSQNNNEYYTGISQNIDVEKAKQDALKNMLEQIQVFVSSSVKRKLQETNTTLTDTTSVEVIAKSSMQLQEVQEEITKDANDIFHVKKFVAKEMVKKMFAQRKQKILEHLQLAQSEIEKGNVGTALKNYYWALLLSEIYPDTISFSFANGKTSSNLSAAIPNEMENIVREIKFRATKKIDDENIVWKCNAEYKGKPITNLNFEYFDGQGQSQQEVHNGETKLTFYFSKTENKEREVLLNVNYTYEDEMDELLQLAQSFHNKSTIANTVMFTLPGEKEKREQHSADSVQLNVNSRLPAPISMLLTAKSFEEVTATLNALAKKNKIIFGSAKDFESREGLYAAVVAQNGIVALLKFEKGKYFDATTGNETDITQFAGKRMIWIEMLK
ncbi:MAG: LPP20 family lipoprotein [Ignavibacteriales bacterium]|nr:LPP20 family lipoprotein [Ignavibacteriales bacterium]